MKKYFISMILLLFLPLFTACQQQTEGMVYLETVDGTAVTEIRNAYYCLKDRFPELYKQLWFTIDIPESLQVYDSGQTDGVVRFADSSGKNLLTLETRFKDSDERYYREYVHTVCANLSELSSFHEYEEPVSVNGYTARRLDCKINTGTETRLISYWFIHVEKSPDNADLYHQSGVCVVSVETTAENAENMLRIINTFKVRGD